MVYTFYMKKHREIIFLLNTQQIIYN